MSSTPLSLPVSKSRWQSWPSACRTRHVLLGPRPASPPPRAGTKEVRTGGGRMVTMQTSLRTSTRAMGLWLGPRGPSTISLSTAASSLPASPDRTTSRSPWALMALGGAFSLF